MTTDGGSARARRSEEPVRLRTPEHPTTLPDWMRDPPPARRTLGTRLTESVAALPGAGAVRRRWWAWQGRERLHQRYPNTVKIVAMAVSFVVSLALVLFAYALYGQR
ncbi:hypothetical protein [Micromonospora sp. WMMD1082]|uniref:hypothetical protein n=1 Tax=Micromonospora sp. WMMD1082 TaxID=3016104 RepID=UPI0024180689|nr:hypothetical protein [Micromonospora sp. WMMD1082]MDG4792473.1 hypothetical protein [Micromonospora sp. WMMD1082]